MSLFIFYIYVLYVSVKVSRVRVVHISSIILSQGV